MRQLDNYDKFTDNNGNPLVGSLTFCKKGTSTQETIYSWDSENEKYVVLNPVQFISIDGRPNTQIFLSDVDYTIYVKKYIGGGDMHTDTDPTHWTNEYSFNNLYDVFGFEYTNDVGLGLFVFENLQDMKSTIAVDMYSDSMVVALAGWATKGDKPITHYYWDANCSENATDVEYVKPQWVTGNGRWVLINEFEQGFDVRNAGCFPTTTSAGDVEQTYALQRANAYCVKYGLKMIIPHTLGSQASCYKISNLIINARTYVMDGVRLYTPDSATLGFLTADNVGRNYPFICRDNSNTGTWSVQADVVYTSWFLNQATNKENWRPSITALSKLVYNKKFDTTYDGNNNHFVFSNIEVDFLVDSYEYFEFTECSFTSNMHIDNPCSFVRCDVEGYIFTAGANIRQMSFTDCVSDIDSWANTTRYLYFAEKNGFTEIDLHGRVTDMDYTSYGCPFGLIRNAVFSGAFKIKTGVTDLILENCAFDNFIIEDNTSIQNIYFRSCDVNIANPNMEKFSEASVTAKNSEFSGDRFYAKSFGIDNCILGNVIYVYADDEVGFLLVEDSIVGDAIYVESDVGFNVKINGNRFGVNGGIVLRSVSTSAYFEESYFCNNVIMSNNGQNRYWISTTSVAGFNKADIGAYVYRNNIGANKDGHKNSFVVKVPYVGDGDTVPTGVTKYIQQIGNNSNNCKLYGFTIDDLLFTFGEDLKSKVLVDIKPRTLANVVVEYDSNKAVDNTIVHMEADSVIYGIGTGASEPVFNGSFGTGVHEDYLYLDHNYVNNGDEVTFILSAERIEDI